MTQGNREIVILLACGRAMACELLSEALSRQAGFQVAACATSVEDALVALRNRVADVALINATLRETEFSGILLAREISEKFPSVKSVILLESPDEEIIESAFRAGARGVFSLTENGFEMLCRCVERVYEGQIWAKSKQLVKLLETFSRQIGPRTSKSERVRALTKREKDVAGLVEEGFTNRQIADELHLSLHTVRNSMSQIFHKLGIATRVELALYLTNGTQRISPLKGSRETDEMDAPASAISASVQ